MNRCKLEGMDSASCDLTHVGKGWYTKKQPDFAGEWSTYNFTWTSGGSYGYAPVTITAGLEKLPAETAPAGGKGADGDKEGAGAGSFSGKARGARTVAVIAAITVTGIVLGGFALI